MKVQIYLWSLSLIILSVSACTDKATDNLIKNSGFEQQNDSGKALPWLTSVHAGVPAYNFNVDKENVFEGNSSFKIEQYKDQGYGIVNQQITLPNKDLKKIVFSAKVFTKEIVEGRGLQLVVNFKTNDGYIIKQVKSKSIIGNTAWTNLSISENLPKGTQVVGAGIILQSIGKIWIDNVSLFVE